MEYYNKDNVIVRDSIQSDADYLSENLRKSDVQEIWASHHVLPNYALNQGLLNSSTCLTVTKGEPLAMFGICPESLISDRAVIWLLATENLMDIRLEFLRYSRKFINLMLEEYPYLYNWVDVRNCKSVYWLRKIGANLSDPAPHGLDKLPFHHFEFRRV